MPRTVAGACERDRYTGERKHQIESRIDGYGNPILACVKCGMMPMKNDEEVKKTKHDQGGVYEEDFTKQ